jgi:AhpC/TSA family protein
VIEEGKPAPTFTLESDNGESVSLESLRGKPVVLYFYPRDEGREQVNEVVSSSGASRAYLGGNCPTTLRDPPTLPACTRVRQPTRTSFREPLQVLRTDVRIGLIDDPPSRSPDHRRAVKVLTSSTTSRSGSPGDRAATPAMRPDWPQCAGVQRTLGNQSHRRGNTRGVARAKQRGSTPLFAARRGEA